MIPPRGREQSRPEIDTNVRALSTCAVHAPFIACRHSTASFFIQSHRSQFFLIVHIRQGSLFRHEQISIVINKNRRKKNFNLTFTTRLPFCFCTSGVSKIFICEKYYKIVRRSTNTQLEGHYSTLNSKLRLRRCSKQVYDQSFG